MSAYDVYGIGNALVDKEFLVDDRFLADNGIKKGFMTLIGEDEQNQLLADLFRQYDLKKRAGGGSAANTLYALSQFGGKAFYSCKVANDEQGDFYVSELGNHNIKTNLSPTREPGTTGRCLVMVTPDAERTMLTHLGISQEVSHKELRLDAVAAARYVYIEGYLVTSDSARDAAIQLKQAAESHGVRTAFTFSDPSMLEYFRSGIDEVLGDSGVDLLFCNEQEALTWSGQTSLDAACRKIEGIARQFVVTLGARGARLFDGEEYSEVAAAPVKAVDTNGAGDMFAGAFLYGITHGHNMHAAGALASLAAGVTVSHIGPRLSQEQHKEILETFVHKHRL